MDKKENNQMQFYELIFNICINLNDHLLGKANNNPQSLTFLEHYLFQASSYIISIIHNKIVADDNSFCNAFVYRCLIECVSIILMHKNGEIPEVSTELINNYNFILEYNIYKKYKETLDGKIFNFNQIEKNYDYVRSDYRYAMQDINNKEFKRLINSSKTPFLLSNYKFHNIVEKYNSECYEYYRLLSFMIHPHDLYISDGMIKTIDFNEVELKVFGDFLECVKLENFKINLNKSFKKELIYILSNKINELYFNYVLEQRDALFKIGDLIERIFPHNTQTLLFKELACCIKSIAVDKMFGFSEIVKCKYKMIVEMLAFNYYISKSPHTKEEQYKFQLMTMHSKIKVYEILNISTDDLWNKAYDLYINNVKKIELIEFKEFFSKSLGFIDNTPSINKLVYDLIDSVLEKDEVLRNHMKLVYDEAQGLSHANGYMIVANTGSFMEYKSVIFFIDQCVQILLDLYVVNWKIYNETEGNHKYNKFIYDIEKQSKIHSKNMDLKSKLEMDFKNYKVNYK